MINFKQLENLFGDMTAIDALDGLCWTFGASQARVYVDGTCFALADLYDNMDVVGLWPAKAVELRFFGGPVGRWWDGNLFTMFLDHFMFAYIKGDKKTVAKILKLAGQTA
jgi:hypothetical protein